MSAVVVECDEPALPPPVRYTRSFVVLDFETTGISHRSGDRITEVAALRVHDGAIVDRYVSLVNCGVRVPDWITGYTGISQAMVDDAPAARDVLPRLLEFLADDVIVAHNAGFDAGFLASECAHAGVAAGHGPFACSVRLARRLYPGLRSYSLAAIAHHVGIASRGRAHRAQADAEVTFELASALIRRAAAVWAFERFDPQLFVLTQKLPIRTVAPLFTGG